MNAREIRDLKIALEDRQDAVERLLADGTDLRRDLDGARKENSSLRAALDNAEEERDAERARAEKAEAELARYDCSAADARICKQQMIEQRSRADRYLAAIMEIGDDRAFIRGDWDTRFCEVRIGIETWRAIRAIVEEAKRG